MWDVCGFFCRGLYVCACVCMHKYECVWVLVLLLCLSSYECSCVRVSTCAQSMENVCFSVCARADMPMSQHVTVSVSRHLHVLCVYFM